MTIKQNKKIKIDLNIHKLFLHGSILLVSSLGLYSVINGAPFHDYAVAIMFPIVGIMIFLDEDKMGISQGKKVLTFMLLGFILLGIIIQSINISREEFIELIKKDHPELVFPGKGCGNSPSEIGEYKLVKINGVYFVKTTKGTSYKPSDLSVYEYEEF